MNRWQEDWFWFCDKCGAIAPKLDIIESEFQLFDDSVATHKECGGRVHVLNSGERNTFPTVTEFKNMPENERRTAMDHIKKFVNGHCEMRRRDEEWEREYKITFWEKLRQSTRNNYQRQLDFRILPAFGSKPIADIRVVDIQKLYNSMDADGLAKGTIQMVKKIMSPVMDYAVDVGYIEKNPFNVKKPLTVGGRKAESHKPLDPEDMKLLRDSLPRLPERERLTLTLLAYTGERGGEVCRFKWEDIDLEKKLLYIKRGITWPDRNQPMIGPPKTENSLRAVPLTNAFLKALQYNGQKGYILQRENGEPMSYTPFNDGFKRAMKHVGIPADKYTPHDFRATCATEWLEAGIPMKTISAMLGHKDTRTTEKYYARIRPEIAYAGVAEMIDSHLEKQAAC